MLLTSHSRHKALHAEYGCVWQGPGNWAGEMGLCNEPGTLPPPSASCSPESQVSVR